MRPEIARRVVDLLRKRSAAAAAGVSADAARDLYFEAAGRGQQLQNGGAVAKARRGGLV